jgi:hypothetical protein
VDKLCCPKLKGNQFHNVPQSERFWEPLRRFRMFQNLDGSQPYAQRCTTAQPARLKVSDLWGFSGPVPKEVELRPGWRVDTMSTQGQGRNTGDMRKPLQTVTQLYNVIYSMLLSQMPKHAKNDEKHGVQTQTPLWCSVQHVLCIAVQQCEPGLRRRCLGANQESCSCTAVCCGDMSWLLDTALCDLWPTCPNCSLSVSGVSSRHPRSFEFQPAMSAVKGTPCMHIET